LEYTVKDFYVIEMQNAKAKYAQQWGYSKANRANYTNEVLPEEPPM
jgi:hypothetical protein